MIDVKKKFNISKFITYLILALIIWAIIAFLVFPNIGLITETFSDEGEFTLSTYERLFNSERAVRSLRNSFILAFSLVITVNILGTFVVLITEYFDIFGSRILKLGYSTTLIYGGIVLATGYKFVYGANGIVTRIISYIYPELDPGWFEGYWAVLFVMTFAITTNHIIFLSDAIRNIDYQTIEAAKNMKASTFYILRKVVLPVLKPSYFAITILIFLIGLGATSAPLILGGVDFQTINPIIISFSKSMTSRDLATALALILGISTILVLVISNVIESKQNYMSISKVKTKMKKQKIKNKFANIIVHIIAYIIFFIYVMPIFFIILFSFTDGYSITTGTLSLERFTLQNYATLFTEFSALKPYITSIVYSLLAALIVGVLILFITRYMNKNKGFLSSTLEYSLLIPWLLPSTLIALGLLVTYDRARILMLGNVLAGTLVILLIGYIIIKIPFTLRMTKAALYQVDDSLEEAAKSMGASPFYTFRKVIFPIILPFILAIFVLNFNGLLADYDLTVFLYHPLYQPLGIVIKQASDSQFNPDAQALLLVYSVVLMILSTIALYFVYGRKRMKL